MNLSKDAFLLLEQLGLSDESLENVIKTRFAHTVIDVQKGFCDPDYFIARGTESTKDIAARIAGLIPKFRAVDVTNIVVYYVDEEVWGLPREFEASQGGPYLIKTSPDLGDVRVGKIGRSAFSSSHFKSELANRHSDILFVSGFNAGSCVQSTVMDALDDDRQVVLLLDCIGQGKAAKQSVEHYVEMMRERGAICSNSCVAIELMDKIYRAHEPNPDHFTNLEQIGAYEPLFSAA